MASARSGGQSPKPTATSTIHEESVATPASSSNGADWTSIDRNVTLVGGDTASVVPRRRRSKKPMVPHDFPAPKPA
jgi:hypothetical protein